MDEVRLLRRDELCDEKSAALRGGEFMLRINSKAHRGGGFLLRRNSRGGDFKRSLKSTLPIYLLQVCIIIHYTMIDKD